MNNARGRVMQVPVGGESPGVCESLGITICARGRENSNSSNKQTNYRNTHAPPHNVSDMEPGELANMEIIDAFEWTHAAPHSVCWKELACANINCILTTWDTSHLDRSWLKDFAALNIAVNSVTRDTSHLDRS